MWNRYPLMPASFVDDGKAGCRSYRRLIPGDFHRAESTSHNPRSHVGTITEIYDYLRLALRRAGTPRCPEHKLSLEAQTVSQMVDAVLAQPQDQRWMLLAPVVNERKGEHLQLLDDLKSQALSARASTARSNDLDATPAIDPKRNTP